MNPPPKYPRTPHWPSSPAYAPGKMIFPDPERFVGHEIVITEKLDGGNTLLHKGKVYGRSTSAPSTAPWNGMVKKRHAWKTTGLDCLIYGENLYAVHSIEYGDLTEDETFRAFALRRRDTFESFDELRRLADSLRIPTVPVVWRGRVGSVRQLDELLAEARSRRSVLDGEREGLVIRTAGAFHARLFADSVAKSVRAEHVRTDEHWSKYWRPCRIRRI